ncbi:hydroxyphenylacetyl-CoA thioesterase PaaI [Nocardiopsis eucommiae]|uniref:Hydroxyphenylacetyl-CoA thioesterase PaaI n=2 Tax=Nocardiopsidaceae TaxID=83676 RepID=A0A975QJ77_9ACTN|nr:hydroxyphenylacetyl-CoA thioesterase PaaI [Nocardiopsis eucommiae]
MSGTASEGRNETAWRMFEADRASKGLGMRLVEARDGFAVVEMVVGPLMLNGYDITHGGFVFALADTAFACACNLDGGDVTVASGADVTFVAPTKEGDLLVATAEERVRFGRSGVYDVTVRRGDEVVAEFRGRSRSLPQRS